MIQDRLTAKFLKNKTSAPKAKAEKKPAKAYRAPAAIDAYLSVGGRRTTIWL
ncbi:hypothetical protein N9O61_02890 [Octadecabacter sp.]|nr:hypothetical protein [Octadecabacter sp.]